MIKSRFSQMREVSVDSKDYQNTSAWEQGILQNAPHLFGRREDRPVSRTCDAHGPDGHPEHGSTLLTPPQLLSVANG